MAYVRTSYLVLLLVTVIFAGSYFYIIAETVCPVPITYRLGEVDSRFLISRDEALLSIQNAETIWEKPTNQELFSYSDSGDLIINFVYDERQRMLTTEEKLKERLDETENITESVNATYDELVSTYDDYKATYEAKVAAYEEKLNAYNAEVEKYNNEGGAPKGVYLLLEQKQKNLDAEQQSLNVQLVKLNAMVAEINALGEKGNTLITNYNKGVETYNEKFGEKREFTQGEYTGDSIEIYTFSDQNELELVLAHELGHALSLNHVEGEESVMHYLIGGQPEEAVVTDFDREEFNRVCGDISFMEKISLALGK